MSTAVAEKSGTQVARPLKVLIPLIQKDYEDAQDASKRAAMPYYIAIGEKLNEAKPQLSRSEFGPWIRRHFEFAERQAQEYMQAFRATLGIENRAAGAVELPETFNEFRREHLGRTSAGGHASWQEPVREAINKINFDRFREEELKQTQERDLQRTLALKLIDIGYKVLATQLHPDKSGGSRDAMIRLNAVRDRLKKFV